MCRVQRRGKVSYLLLLHDGEEASQNGISKYWVLPSEGRGKEHLTANLVATFWQM